VALRDDVLVAAPATCWSRRRAATDDKGKNAMLMSSATRLVCLWIASISAGSA